jgi:hypothetical protein
MAQVKVAEDVRLGFDQYLFKTQPSMTEGGTPKRGTILIFAKNSEFHKAVVAAMNKVCGEKYQSPEIWKTLQRDKRCLRTGEEQVDKNGNVRPAFKDQMLLVVKNPKPILIVDADRTILTAESPRPYAGCYVRPIVDIYAFEVKGARGVYATITGLQFSKDGERISGGSTASVDDFQPLGEGLGGATASAASVFDN